MRFLLTGLASVLFTTFALTSAHAGGHHGTVIAHASAPIGAWQASLRHLF